LDRFFFIVQYSVPGYTKIKCPGAGSRPDGHVLYIVR